MKISRLVLKNVRAVEDFSLDLAIGPGEPRLRSLLIGVNGAGKTTILDSIVHVFQSLSWSLGMNGSTLGAGDVRNVEDPEMGTPSRAGPQSGLIRLHTHLSPQEQSTTLSVFGAKAEGELSFPIGELPDVDLTPVLTNAEAWDLLDAASALNDDNRPLGDPSISEELNYQDAVTNVLLQQRPPCLFLPADRGVLEDRDDVPVKALKSFDPRADCLSRSRERFATLAARLALATVDPRHEGHRAVTRMWKAAEKYFPEMPALVSAEGLQLRFRTRRGGLVPLRALSDGERAVLLLLGEIALRPASQGVVLIDELEQHLHPRWQKAILQALIALVPTAQIILTTQSPYLAASAPDDLVKIGDWDRDGQ
jgi:ABC-type branched-subunit amino acid transport system ATPase component